MGSPRLRQCVQRSGLVPSSLCAHHTHTHTHTPSAASVRQYTQDIWCHPVCTQSFPHTTTTPSPHCHCVPEPPLSVHITHPPHSCLNSLFQPEACEGYVGGRPCLWGTLWEGRQCSCCGTASGAPTASLAGAKGPRLEDGGTRWRAARHPWMCLPKVAACTSLICLTTRHQHSSTKWGSVRP